MTSKNAKTDFAAVLERECDEIEKRLVELADEVPDNPAVIKGAMRYSLLGGGKRLRPVLCLWTHDMLGGRSRNACLDAACAIECLHTYSLIHDDLPCMDDDDMRRGKPSSHKEFGEAIAVLAGDALLTLCFEILSSIGERWHAPEADIVEVTKVVARAAGAGGIIRGQVLDLMWENKTGDEELVETIHTHKTASLIGASMETGAVLAGADGRTRAAVRTAGVLAGRAFQIMDDVLDVEADDAVLGKTAGKDASQGKLTYPSVVGPEVSKTRAFSLVSVAKSSLRQAGGSCLLESMFDFFVRRKY